MDIANTGFMIVRSGAKIHLKKSEKGKITNLHQYVNNNLKTITGLIELT